MIVIPYFIQEKRIFQNTTRERNQANQLKKISY